MDGMRPDQVAFRLLASRGISDRYVCRRSAYRCLITYLLFALGCVLVARGQSPILTDNEPHVGIRETAKHRPSPAPLRCLNYGGVEKTRVIWVDVDLQGRVLASQPADGSQNCSSEFSVLPWVFTIFRLSKMVDP